MKSLIAHFLPKQLLLHAFPLIGILFLYSELVCAEASLYHRVNVGERVSILIPKHWHIRDINERRNIAAAGEAIIGSVNSNDPVYVSALSAISTPPPVGGIVRVTYIPTSSPEEQLSQQIIENAYNNEFDETISELNQAFSDEMKVVSAGLKKNGIEVLEHGPSNMKKINETYALMYTYRRTSAYGQSPFRVTQYHIPLGLEKVMITLSYRETDAPMFRPIMNEILDSLIIK